MLRAVVTLVRLQKRTFAGMLSAKLRTGKLKEFYKTQLKRTEAPPQSVRKKQKPKGEAAPQRNYSHSAPQFLGVRHQPLVDTSIHIRSKGHDG